jgi:hypothetical protein
MNRFATKVLAAVIVVGCASLRVGAQESSGAKPQTFDEKILKYLKDGASKGVDGQGLLFIGSTIFQNNLINNMEKCLFTQVSVGRVIDRKYRSALTVKSTYRFLGDPRHYEPALLKSGEYYVGWVKCRPSVDATGGTTFNGPHAKLTIKAGELLDAGSLKLEYRNDNIFTGRGKTRVTVERTDPERLAEMKKKMPVAMKKLVTRPMVTVGATERDVKRPGPF